MVWLLSENKEMKFACFVFSTCLLLVCSGFIQAQQKTVDFVELGKTIEAEIKENKTPGAAIAVIMVTAFYLPKVSE